MLEENIFEIEDSLGNKRILTAVSFVEDFENNTIYMIYTDNTFDENNVLNLFVSKVIKENDEFHLEDIEDYEHIDLITKEIDRIIKEM